MGAAFIGGCREALIKDYTLSIAEALFHYMKRWNLSLQNG
jgi:hypothetical protein